MIALRHIKLFMCVALFVSGCFILDSDGKAHASDQDYNGLPKDKENKKQTLSPIQTPLKYIEIDIIEAIQESGLTLDIPNPEMSTSTSDYKISIKLGGAVTGIICSVMYQDKSKFLKYATIIHNYGEILGIEEIILSKYGAISRSASDGKWEEVKYILFNLKEDVSVELINEDMKDCAVLATTTAWLEGIHIVANSLDREFKKDILKLVYDRDFVEYLIESLHSVDEELKDKTEIKAFLDALPKIEKIINQPGSYSFTKEDVQKILDITLPLHKIIMT